MSQVTSVYATPSHRAEQLLQQRPWQTPVGYLPGLELQYEYDKDGRVTKRHSLDDSVGSADTPNYEEYVYTNDAGISGLESVMKAVKLGETYSAVFLYHYGKDNQRIRKEHPGGAVASFYYGPGSQLLAESYEGATSGSAGMDDYVYLGGRPVFVMRGQQTTAGHSYEWSNADCERLVDSSFSTSLQTCVPYGLVTDVIGKPILTVDIERRISGVGEYEPYGALNRAAWWGQQTPEPASSGWNVFVNGVPSPHDGMELQVRAHLPWRDVRADTAVLLYDNNYSYLWYAWGRPPQLGGIVNWTPWLTLTTDYFHLVRYAVGTGNGVTPLGVAFDGYEYKRYEAGATPYFPNLRFPGQYYDEETHTHQNWNRVYFPETGSYSAIEPLLQRSRAVWAVSAAGRFAPGYAYAGSNPVANSDATGNFWGGWGRCAAWSEALQLALKQAGCTTDSPGCFAAAQPNKCQEKLEKCPETRGCDICGILREGSGPLITFHNVRRLAPQRGYGPRLPDALAFIRWDPVRDRTRSIDFAGDEVVCADVEELADTLVHEAAHVCREQTGNHVADGDTLCDAAQIAGACMR